MTELHGNWRKNFDVYDRLKDLGIDLGAKENTLPAPKGRRICMLTLIPTRRAFSIFSQERLSGSVIVLSRS